MKIGVAGSIGLDHLMTFSGKFTDSFVTSSLEKISLSFLVDDLEVRRGGTGANIAFGLGVLGINPTLIAAAGMDFSDYDAWLSRHGVDTSHVVISESLHTAHFVVTTDTELNPTWVGFYFDVLRKTLGNSLRGLLCALKRACNNTTHWGNFLQCPTQQTHLCKTNFIEWMVDMTLQKVLSVRGGLPVTNKGE